MIKIVKQPMLISGQMRTDDANNIYLYIDDEQPLDEQRHAIIHELVHAVLYRYDPSLKSHSESRVDAIAKEIGESAVLEMLEFTKTVN